MTVIDTSPKSDAFGTKHRFVMKSNSNSQIHQYITQVSLDYINKEITLEVLDVHIDGDALTNDWISSLIKDSGEERLALTQYNSKGDILAIFVFSELTTIGHRYPLSYNEMQDPYARHELMIRYRKKEDI